MQGAHTHTHKHTLAHIYTHRLHIYMRLAFMMWCVSHDGSLFRLEIISHRNYSARFLGGCYCFWFLHRIQFRAGPIDYVRFPKGKMYKNNPTSRTYRAASSIFIHISECIGNVI